LLLSFVEAGERIYYQHQMAVSKKRYDTIMATIKMFLKCRTHKELFESIQNNLAQNFGFEFASILFSEDSESLYSMNGPDEDNKPHQCHQKEDFYETHIEKQEENDRMSKLPKNIGLAGISIEKRAP
jgi:uncharacterized protein YigA (DUF484 family)